MSTSSLTFKAGGTLEESNFYLERTADEELPKALLRGEFCYVLAPRQMGKSSLRYRVARRLSTEHAVRCATIDLTGIGTSTSQADDWYFGIVDELARQLGDESLRTATEDFWVEQAKLPIVQRFTRFLREVLLAQTTGPVVLFVDEIDAVRALRFESDDFFAAIRAVYNARPDDPEYKRLSICLLGVAQPGDLIRNEQITPFNIGTRIELLDFERHELDPLCPVLGQLGGDPARLLDAVYGWTQGHPYMALTICAELVPSHEAPQRLAPGQESQHISRLVDTLFFQRSRQRNPNLDYAEKCFQRGNSDPRIAKMLALYARLVRGERIAADGRDLIQGALLLTGMAAPTRSDSGAVLQIRNRIFATVFDSAWVKTQQSERFLSEPLHRWLDSGRKDDFVLRGEALREAERWVDQRVDTTSEEQEFLRACWRVHSAEERVRAEGAVQSAHIAQAEAEAAQAKTIAERLEKERAESQTIAERAERKRAESLAFAEKARRERSVSAVPAQSPTVTIWILGLLVFALAVILAVVSGLFIRSKAEERDRVKLSRTIERSAFVVRQEGLYVNSLHGWLQTIRSLQASVDVPVLVIDRLTNTHQEYRYPLFPPWRHKKQVVSAGFSPDGSKVLTASDDGTAVLWDTKSGAALFTFRGHSKGLRSASFSSDGTGVVTTSEDGTARIWNVTSGMPLLVINDPSKGLRTASFSFDGSKIVTASEDGTARIWDAKTGASLFLLKGHTKSVTAASFSIDGSQVVTSSEDHTARIWDSKTGTSVFILDGHSKGVVSAVFSSNGSHIVTASHDGTARLWDAKLGTDQSILMGHWNTVVTASFSPNDSLILTASYDGTARVWRTMDGGCQAILKGHSDQVLAASFSPDGDRVVTASTDGTARIWNVNNETELLILESQSQDLIGASFSPDGSHVVANSRDGSVFIWDAKTNFSFPTVKVQRAARSLSPDGSRVLFVEGSSSGIGDTKTGSLLFDLMEDSMRVGAASFSPDGKRVVTAGVNEKRDAAGNVIHKDAMVHVWGANTGLSLFSFAIRPVETTSVVFSPDGNRVLTLNDDHSGRIWDVQTGTLLITIPLYLKAPVASFSPDGRYVAIASQDGTTHFWDANTGKWLFRLKGHSGEVLDASFSPDGRRFVTASADRTARLWLRDNNGGFTLQTILLGHSEAVANARFSPDSTRIVTASFDGTTRIWDVQTGILMMNFANNPGGYDPVAFSRDGTELVTIGRDGLYIHSTKLDFYMRRACELLRGHRDEFQDVTDVCKRVGVLPLPPLPNGIPVSQTERSGGAD